MAAIERIGLPNLSGQNVVIRPNQIDTGDGVTNTEVIRGVIQAVNRACLSGPVGSIVVAEDAFASPAGSNMQTNGVVAVCAEEGATTLDLSGTATTNHAPAGAGNWGGGLDFYDTVYEADYVINVPRCKCHGSTNFSMALKAWFGSVRRPGDLHGSGNLHDKCAEAHLVKQESFVVLDATECMVTGGPQRGTMRDSGIVAATKDAILADVTGLAIIRHFGDDLDDSDKGPAFTVAPWQQRQILKAMSLSFPGWVTEATDYSYDGEGISTIDDIMAKRTA